jgi:hypothetical protein
MNNIFMLAFVLPVILGVVILVTGGLLLALNSRRNNQKGQVETEDWEMAGGKVLASHLGEHESRRTDKHGTHVDITYEPVVEYIYSVDNVEYHGSKVFPNDDSDFGQSEAQAIIDKYPLNSYAPVRYDPQNPSASSLEAHSPHTTHHLLVAGQSLLALGIGVCCFTSFMMFILVGRIR